jgi:MFS transporter, ACS family, pantothenate transporter
MAYPQEKAVKGAFFTDGSEIPVVLESEIPGSDAPVYTQSKRTWKSYFWSSESSKLRKHGRIIADQP